MNSASCVVWKPAVDPSGSGLFSVGRFLIVDSMSTLVTCLFSVCISM